MSMINNAGTFLIYTAFNLYLLALVLRFVLEWRKISDNNPISQLLLKVTEPVLQPIRQFIPQGGRWNYPLLTVWFVVDLLKWFLLSVLSINHPGFFGILTLIFADAINLVVDVYFYAILGQIILSWMNSPQGNAVTAVLNTLTAPILEPVRRTIPQIGGFDLSPLVALIGLKLIEIVFVNPLFALAL